MCLILFALNTNSTHRLIVAANRDEFYQRPSLPAHFWDNSNTVLAGKDLEKQGTWLGVTKTGRFAAVTNFRRPDTNKYPLSRGILTAEFLEGNQTPETYLQDVATKQAHFAGFNLLVGDDSTLCYFSNRSNMPPSTLEPGIYGLSNHLLNTPWPKVTTGISAFSQALVDSGNDEDTLQLHLLNVLHNNQHAGDSELPETGIGSLAEKMLSPLFIKSPSYGTRASTVLQITKNEEISFLEQNYTAGGVPAEKMSFNL